MRLKTLALTGLLMVGAPVLADDTEHPANWAAAPYWVPPAAPEEGSGPAPAAGRTARAGRQPLVAGPTALPFIALPPCRVVDTRGNAPLTGGFLPPATVRSYTVTNVCGIPPGAQALSLNATVVHPTGPGFLTLYPQGGSFPPVSTLNYLGNDVVVNAAVVPLSAGGGISMALGVSGGDVILDTNGYYAPQAVVSSLNALSGSLTLAAGSNVTITPSGSTLTIASTAAGGPPTGPAGGGLSGSYPNPTVVSTSGNVPNSIVSRNASGSFAVGSLSFEGRLDFFDARLLHLSGTPTNLFLGLEAGSLSVTGGGNVAVGYNVLRSISSGSENTGSGWQALASNTVGSANTALGSQAMSANTTSSGNTAVGFGALNGQAFPNSGTQWSGLNTAVGYAALGQTNSTNAVNGRENTAVGAASLMENTSGFHNTALGSFAGFRSGFGTGYVGSINYVANTTGNYNTFVGRGTGATAANIFNCTAVGIDAYCDGNDQVRLGNPYVGSIGGKVGWSALSDARAKRDIRDLDLGLDFVLRLRPVEYTLKLGNGRRDLGFLAQDVEALLGADYNVVTVGGDPHRTLSLRYTDLIAPVVKAIQEQQAMLDAKSARVDDLERRLAALEERLAPRTAP